MFEQIFGELGLPARAVVALVLVLALIALTVWLMRRFGDGRISTQAGGRGRQQRLAVLDSATVDARRKLVLIRRDNVEHLLLIGGPTDVVVEPNIVRAQPAGGARPGARPGAFEDEDTSLIPEAPQMEPERPAPAPAARAPQHGPSEPPRTMPRPAQKLDPQYADMAQRLEQALRKPSPEPEATRPAPAPRMPAPEPRSSVPEPRMEPRPTQPAPAPRAPMPRIPEPHPEPRVETPRVETPRPQPAQGPQQAPQPQPAHAAPGDQAAADVFSSLEEEMASLLRPGGKKDPKK